MNKKVAVLGAGPMGLAVAYELVKNGYQPVVFEADDRVGGMTAAFDFSGLSIERYYHFHCISDSGFLKVLDELSLRDKMNWVPTKMGYWYNNELQSWGNPVALLKFRGLGMVAKFRYGLHAFLCTKRSDWRPLDGVDAITWIKKWVGAEAYEVLWRRLFDYKFYDYKDDLSAAWIWSRIRRIGKSRYNLFKEKLGYLEGGSETLLKAMAQYITEHGGIIKLNAKVEKVQLSGGKVVAIESGGEVYSFDRVVSTVPLPFINKIIPDLPSPEREKFASLKNIAVVCIIVKLKKQLTENFWLNTNDPEMDIPGLVEYSNLRPLDDHIVYVPFYMPGDHPKYLETDEQFIAKVKRYLIKINPLLNEDDFIDVKASRYRYAQPICQPHYLRGIPEARLPVGGLWVADTSYYYPEDRGISESIDFGRKLALDVISG
ncbi:NAD(P)/FAD-dependent oxidoreductase [Pseudomonas syringae group sp. J309-1]|uniref:NAD(P)/FAD-dependent oxidoreductase n=1 Tax=Pseudomonas syringae group sp. J309-1 TaxID=3079588 RepID=UPI00210C5D35|nr:NAD(P)/FAD-dependent oxidoreductase [Pseudomonas syringae group sp. J309-1]MCQ2999053.1 NAD(P)/FAD-dependent oxidoreductase [Pseudomonas syringae]MDU8361886.1 NAD(P)/FAD-dependent oxidoreductase [Pseudomonas syringae group sp. J309-1]